MSIGGLGHIDSWNLTADEAEATYKAVVEESDSSGTMSQVEKNETLNVKRQVTINGNKYEIKVSFKGPDGNPKTMALWAEENHPLGKVIKNHTDSSGKLNEAGLHLVTKWAISLRLMTTAKVSDIGNIAFNKDVADITTGGSPQKRKANEIPGEWGGGRTDHVDKSLTGHLSRLTEKTIAAAAAANDSRVDPKELLSISKKFAEAQVYLTKSRPPAPPRPVQQQGTGPNSVPGTNPASTEKFGPADPIQPPLQSPPSPQSSQGPLNPPQVQQNNPPLPARQEDSTQGLPGGTTQKNTEVVIHLTSMNNAQSKSNDSANPITQGSTAFQKKEADIPESTKVAAKSLQKSRGTVIQEMNPKQQEANKAAFRVKPLQEQNYLLLDTRSSQKITFDKDDTPIYLEKLGFTITYQEWREIYENAEKEFPKIKNNTYEQKTKKSEFDKKTMKEKADLLKAAGKNNEFYYLFDLTTIYLKKLGFKITSKEWKDIDTKATQETLSKENKGSSD